MPKQIRDANYSIEHSLQRFKERYEQNLPLKTYQEWNSKIRNLIGGITQPSNMVIIKKTTVTKTNDSYVIEITHENKKIYANFETERNCITTFLPIKSFI